MSQNNKPSQIVRYKWDPDWADQIVHNLPIVKVADELSTIKEVYGELTPENLIESSKNKKSIFHHYFEWDDAKAANAFRLKRASQILQHIEIKVVKGGERVLLKATEVIASKPERFNDMAGHKKHITLSSRDEYSPEYVLSVKRTAASELNLVIKKLERIMTASNIIDSLKIAVEELSKDSTETRDVV